MILWRIAFILVAILPLFGIRTIRRDMRRYEEQGVATDSLRLAAWVCIALNVILIGGALYSAFFVVR